MSIRLKDLIVSLSKSKVTAEEQADLRAIILILQDIQKNSPNEKPSRTASRLFDVIAVMPSIVKPINKEFLNYCAQFKKEELEDIELSDYATRALFGDEHSPQPTPRKHHNK